MYGTLRHGGRNADLLAGASFLGLGWIEGALHLMPVAAHRPYAYPALVKRDGGRVRVECYRLTDASQLARLDELEGFDATNVPSSEYVRRAVPIIDGPVAEGWVYWYADDPDALGPPIESGDWTTASQLGSR